VGVEEYVDLDLDEFQRRSNERLLTLVERSRSSIERDLGRSFAVSDTNGRIELTVQGEPVYVATTTAAGRLLLTDVSGRYNGRL
jgi:hypothetical protein